MNTFDHARALYDAAEPADLIEDEERDIIEGWLAFVERTHQDRYTMAALRETLARRDWCPSMVAFGRRLLEAYSADTMQAEAPKRG